MTGSLRFLTTVILILGGICLITGIILEVALPLAEPTPVPIPVTTESTIPTSFPSIVLEVTRMPSPTRSSTPMVTQSPSPTATTSLEGMVYIPGAEFQMGSDDQQQHPDEYPPTQVAVSHFWLDQHEVTNADYRECVSALVCKAPHRPEREGGSPEVASATRAHYYDDPQYDLFPVIFVSWSDALQYCQWRGKRLPTEAEWEWAAKGPNSFLYPWGNEETSSARANYTDANTDDTRAVGESEPSAVFGLYDMAGNVWEWTSSLYMPYPYLLDDGREDLEAEGKRVLRGGSWRDGPDSLRSTNRDAGTEPDYPLDNVGFRCAKSAE